MADTATFEIALADKVTGASNAIVGSFNSILHAAVNAVGGPEKVLGAMEAVGKAKEVLGTVSAAFGPIGDAASAAGGFIVSMAEVAGAALLALAAAIVGTTLALADLAIKAGEAKTQMLSSFSALEGGAAAGEATLKAIDAVGDSLGMTREQLGPYAEKLLAAGMAADKLQGSLRAVAAANAIIAGGGEKVTSLLAKLNEEGMKGSKIKFSPTMLVGTGVKEEELMKALGMTPKMFELAKKQGKITGGELADAIVKVLGSKGAGPLADQANKLTNIWLKFKESVTELFDDVTSSPGYKEFVGALKKFFSFGTSATGQLKSTITDMFSKLFSWAAKTLPYIKMGVEKIVVAVLKAILAVKLWYKEGGKKDIVETWTRLATAIKVVGPGLLLAAEALAAFIGLSAKAQDVSASLTTGIANGIIQGTPKVIAAVKGLGTAVIAALKSVLAIASPSKVFAQLGGHTAAGFAAGLKGGTGGVKAASAGMAASALQGAAGAPGKGGKAGAGGGKGNTYNFAPGSIVVQGASAQSASELTETMFSTVLERIRVSQGIGT